MKLSVMDRLTTSGILPQKASYTNHMLIEKARELLSFNEAEHKLLNFRPVDNQTFWDQSRIYNKSTGEAIPKDLPKEMVETMIAANPENFEMKPTVDEVEIDLGDVVTKLITKALETLDKAEDLSVQQLALYKKFLKPEQT